MDLTALTALEYNKIRDMLAARTSSVMGRELAELLTPTSNVGEVIERLAETGEARDILHAVPNIPLGDIRAIIKRAELGAVLEPHELLAVGSTLYAARRMKVFFNDLPVSAPKLTAIAGTITVLHDIEKKIDAAINDQGEIRDDASPELRRIRREIKQMQNRVREKLHSILHSADYQKFFQDVLVTMRGDRYVIPVKQEYRHSFPGIVHDQSASGATVYIEPMAVVNLNNDLKQRASAEKNEVERILAELSAQVAEVAASIGVNCEALAKLDFAVAKARLCLDMRGEIPEINQDGYLNLRQARHPLIPNDVAVPIDVNIGKDFSILLVTGPNTGGKTVTLKTVGLFALMNQAGLCIPVDSGSEMCIFNNVFADIGDEQSIEQSLSTFSAHMTNLVRILNQVTSDDLVLIDEIGAGTDPEEGAALAMAILEYLHGIGTRTVATTHYSELKTFAFSRHGIENSSVEFDVQTLRPTYRLLIGIPGSSNAFAISKRLGLDENVIKRAGQLMDQNHTELETVFTALEEEKRSYMRRNDEVTVLQRELTALRQQIYSEQEKMADKKRALLEKAQDDASALLRQARREADEIIAELKAQFSAQNIRDAQAAMNKARKRLRDTAEMVGSVVDNEDIMPPTAVEVLEPGADVYVTTLKQKGIVLSTGTDDVLVQLGIMKVNVPITDCRLIAGTKESGVKKPAAKAGISLAKTQDVARQVDIRGLTVEEAQDIIDKYIDDAVLAGLNEVIVIHGKGTGALRKGIRAYLKAHSYVKDIQIAELNQGGDGATAVKLI